MEWTSDQQNAINLRHKNILVSAAAGSGKTALLIERIRKLVVEERVNISQILVMTFTRAAANEMKERLSQSLVKNLEENKGDIPWIMEQIQGLSHASISTVHAFCGSLVREYFQESGIDPDFKQGNETELLILYQESIEEAMERAYNTIPENGENEFSKLVDCFTGNKDDGQLKKLVEKAHNFFVSLPSLEDWKSEALKLFKMDHQTFWTSTWGKTMRAEISVDLKEAHRILSHCYDELEGSEIFSKNMEDLREEMSQIQQALMTIDVDYQKFLPIFNNIEIKKHKSQKKQDPDTNEWLKNERANAKEILKSIQEKYGHKLETAMEDLQTMMGNIQTLFVLVEEVACIYQEKKERKGILDYNDLEGYTLKILKNPDIVEELKNRFAHIFLDEYQDTNGIQETIVKTIARSNNYFMVGDVKQSIYRFRLADPEIFLKKYHTFSQDGDHCNELINLSQNFRSCQGVVDGVNMVFEHIMSSQFGDVDYDERAKLYKGLPKDGSYEKLEINILTGGEEEDGEETVDSITKEAQLIAKKIHDMVGQPIFDTKSGETHLIRYKDIGLLMRSVAKRGDKIAKILAENGIPAYYEGEKTYYESIEVQLILNLLKIIDNGNQDLPLLSVMLSPIGGFTVEECSILGINKEENYYHKKMNSYVENHQDELSQKIQTFLNTLEGWRFDGCTLDVETFLWKLFMDTGYYTFISALPGGEQRQNNLRMLIRRAGEYKNATLRGIYHFIRFVERMKKHQYDASPPRILSENEDVVRIMTIHKSKGLEFPVVILSGLGKNFRVDGNSSDILFHKDLGCATMIVNPTKRMRYPSIAMEICKSKMAIESLAEEMRILYVGMTRARERLIFVGSVKDLEKSQEKWKLGTGMYQLKKGKCFLDWIMPTMRQEMSLAFDEKNPCESEKVTIIYHNQGTSGIPTEKINLDETRTLSQETKKEILRRLRWQYPHPIKNLPPEKISVTDFKDYLIHHGEQKGGEIPLRVQRPAFLSQEQKDWTGAEMGTRMHQFLQSIHLKPLDQAIESGEDINKILQDELKRLIYNEILEPEMEKELDLEHVIKFFQSDLGQRLRKAKVVQKERPFNYMVHPKRLDSKWQEIQGEILVQGMIDCCFLENEEWVLLDYKTDVFRPGRGREELVKSYGIQIELYAEALEALTQKKVKEKVLYFLRMNEGVWL